VKVSGVFDKRISEITNQWKTFLLEGESKGSAFQPKSKDKEINRMVKKVESALRALKLKSMDLTPKQNKKRKVEDNNEYYFQNNMANFAWLTGPPNFLDRVTKNILGQCLVEKPYGAPKQLNIVTKGRLVFRERIVVIK